MAEHTPGPWWTQGRAVKAKIGGREITVAGAKLYIEPDPESAASTFADSERAEANARLIAAAPELLEVCRIAQDFISGDILDRLRGEALNHAAIVNLRLLNAIAKADPPAAVAEAEGGRSDG